MSLEFDAERHRIAVTERFRLGTIATFNRRDFAVVRPVHIEAFELVP